MEDIQAKETETNIQSRGGQTRVHVDYNSAMAGKPWFRLSPLPSSCKGNRDVAGHLARCHQTSTTAEAMTATALRDCDPWTSECSPGKPSSRVFDSEIGCFP